MESQHLARRRAGVHDRRVSKRDETIRLRLVCGNAHVQELLLPLLLWFLLRCGLLQRWRQLSEGECTEAEKRCTKHACAEEAAADEPAGDGSGRVLA